MRYKYFNYFGRPARLTVDDKDVPQFCEVWDSQQKMLVRNDWAETDLFYNTERADGLTEQEFAALIQLLQQS